MYTPFTHTETTHPGSFWGAVVGGPRSAVEVWTPEEASELACLSCLYLTAPLPPGWSVSVWCEATGGRVTGATADFKL